MNTPECCILSLAAWWDPHTSNAAACRRPWGVRATVVVSKLFLQAEYERDQCALAGGILVPMGSRYNGPPAAMSPVIASRSLIPAMSWRLRNRRARPVPACRAARKCRHAAFDDEKQCRLNKKMPAGPFVGPGYIRSYVIVVTDAN